MLGKSCSPTGSQSEGLKMMIETENGNVNVDMAPVNATSNSCYQVNLPRLVRKNIVVWMLSWWCGQILYWRLNNVHREVSFLSLRKKKMFMAMELMYSMMTSWNTKHVCCGHPQHSTAEINQPILKQKNLNLNWPWNLSNCQPIRLLTTTNLLVLSQAKKKTS